MVQGTPQVVGTVARDESRLNGIGLNIGYGIYQPALAVLITATRVVEVRFDEPLSAVVGAS